MLSVTEAMHPLLLLARQVIKPGQIEPRIIDADARDHLTRAIRDYADQPDLAEGIRALGALAMALAAGGSPSAGRAVVSALEQVGPELEFRFDAGEIAAALDEVGLESSAFAKS